MAARATLRALPNIISLSRVLLAAGFVVVERVDVRLGLVGLAGITDFLDGWLARRARWTTRLGALIDPFADRVFALVAVSTFLFMGELSTVGYFIMISRDLMTAIGFLVSRFVPWLQSVEFKARMSGKIVTVLQLITFAALLGLPSLVTPCLWLVGITSVYSIVDYTYALWRARKQ
ncbi:MAG TPA: CDP-alcohol phosphatidyltransferase family protein [Gemmatimonadaceae bacterium]|nr:CDP-alcohol phosphatidyltransferase family protein [Gemmatimonadaceae bacterium]